MIFLFTDFGYVGPYVGQMKAAIAADAPGVPVIDLMHDAPVHNAKAGAYLLAALASHLPEGSITVAVVDPGVGSARAGLILEAGNRAFVGPDNGLLDIVARRDEGSFRRLPPPDKGAAASFHGRDVFAPAAARLIQGGRIESERFTPEVRSWPDDLKEVIYIDGFGNAMTGLRASEVPKSARFRIGGKSIARARTFSDVKPGEAFWYENSQGLVEIAVNQERAAERLGLCVGSAIEIQEN